MVRAIAMHRYHSSRRSSTLLPWAGLCLSLAPLAGAEYTHTLTRMGLPQPGWSVIQLYGAAEGGLVGGGNLLPNNDIRAWHYASGTWTELGLLPGGDQLRALDVNASGQVVGYGTTKPNSLALRGFLYQGGTLTALEPLGASPYLGEDAGGKTSRANALNDQGQVVGNTSTSSGVGRAFLYENGQMRDLGALTPNGNSEANGINNLGVAVGSADGLPAVFENGTVRALGSSFGQAVVINDAGMIAGAIGTSAFVYENGVLTNIGTLGGPQAKATGINNRGEVVGASTVGYNPRCFLYANGVMRDLAELADFSQDFLSPNVGSCAIDEEGRIYGFALNKSFANELFVLTPRAASSPFQGLASGQWSDLGALGWHYGFQNGPGWSYSLSLGFIYSAFHPWLYHPTQGFLYVMSGNLREGLYLYSVSLGVILWTADSTAGLAYRLDTMATLDLLAP